jgi:hypothetical protein
LRINLSVDIHALLALVRRLPASETQAFLNAVGLREPPAKEGGYARVDMLRIELDSKP